MKWNWKQILISLSLGIIVGVAVARWCGHHAGHRMKSPEKKFERKLKWFTKKLDLSPAQAAQVKEIFQKKHDSLNILHEEMRPRFEALRETGVNEVREILNEEQRVKFEKLEAKRHKWREKKRRHLPY